MKAAQAKYSCFWMQVLWVSRLWVSRVWIWSISKTFDVTIMSSLYHPFFKYFFPDFYLSYFHIWQCHVIQHQVDIHVVEAINIYFSWKFCFYILFSCESLHVCTTKSTSGNHHHNLRVAMVQRFVAMAAASCQCRFQHTNFSLSLHLLNLCSCKGADSRLKITWLNNTH